MHQTDSKMFSIIIPTLNEEMNIGRVISQFKLLDSSYDYEIIIGDGNSIDRTTEIASKLGAIIAIDTTGNNTIASGRVVGATAAKGDILIFCDADTILSNSNKLAEEINEVFRDPSVVAAIPRMEIFFEQQTLKDKIVHWGFNLLVRLSFRLPAPIARGQCQIVRTSSFWKVGGYNVRQVHGEDSSLFKQLAKIGKLKFISDVTIYESPRRYRKYGYCQVALLGVYSIIGQAILNRNILHQWERVD